MVLASRSSNVQRILTLRTFPAFASLQPHEIVVMAEHCRDCFFEKGAIVARSGVPVTGLHLIVQGRIRIDRDGVPYRTMNELESVGDIASITMDPRGIDAIAIEDTTTLALDREDMVDVFEDNFSIMSAVMRVLARTLVEARLQRGPSAGFGPSETPGEHRATPLTLMDRIFILTNTMSFEGSNLDALAHLANDTKEVRYEPQEALWSEGDSAGHFIRIVSGMVACSNDTQAFELGAGSMVGGVDSMAGDPRWYDAKAITPVVGLWIGTSDLLDVYEDNVDMGMTFMRVLAHAIEEQYEAIMRATQAKASTAP